MMTVMIKMVMVMKQCYALYVFLYSDDDDAAAAAAADDDNQCACFFCFLF